MQVVMCPGMTTDWVLVMVSIPINASVDPYPFPILEVDTAARKDPDGDNAAVAKLIPPGYASSMVSLAKSKEPSDLQSRMIEVSYVRAMQPLSEPPAKHRERIRPRWGLKEWVHDFSFIFQTLISPLNAPDAKMLESVREKDNAVETERLPTRIVSACFGVRMGVFEEKVA
jgi:hypothetical protein